MRRLSLNLLTFSVTLLLLGVLTMPALRVLSSAPSDPSETLVLAADAHRVFGVYVDPWHVDDWARQVGVAPQLVAKFEAFSRREPIDHYLQEAQRRGLRRVMVSWEPWRPVPAALGLRAQQRPQPGYRNVDIAAGAQDPYITNFARSLARFKGRVYLRFAHEMNGFWYPWSRNARAYVRAWRHVVSLFRRAGARNVAFVWSANPNLYERRGTWSRNLDRYWPGSRYVDYVGSTMINFGGDKEYAVPGFFSALRTLRSKFGKPVVLTETNTAYDGRVRWLDGLRQMLARAGWIHAVVWSQLPSRGKVQRGNQVGNTDWDVTRDKDAAAALRGVAEDGGQ